jgi:hypothetical protein
MWIAEFDTVKEAREFLETGIARLDENPEIWFEMVKLTPDGRRRFDVEGFGA